VTFLPLESWLVKARSDLKPYRVPARCAHPDCELMDVQAHHLWRRSFIGGDIRWVELPDGRVVGNLVPLCWTHHKLITENQASIVLCGDTFVWAFRVNGEDHLHAPLTYQPPVGGGLETASDRKDSEEPTADRCETCGHVKRRHKVELPPGERRPRASWTIAVPKDHREDGAYVLDSLLEEAAKILERDEHTSWRYYTAVEALAMFVQHGHLMVKDA
jgi:hypothetical protein